LSNENSKIYANEKSSYLTITLCPVADLGPIMGLSALFIGRRNTCCGLWAVFAEPVAWDQT